MNAIILVLTMVLAPLFAYYQWYERFGVHGLRDRAYEYSQITVVVFFELVLAAGLYGALATP